MAEVQVSVTALSGDLVWGPAPVLDSEKVLSVRRMVAGKMRTDPYEISLVRGGAQLADEASLAEAGVADNGVLTVVRVDAVGEQESLLARLLERATPVEGGIRRLWELAINGSRELHQAADDDGEAGPGPGGGAAWLAEVAASCGCGGAGLPRDVGAMLEAIARSGRALGQGYFTMSAGLIERCPQGAGLLCIEEKSCETGFRRTLVDLTGELAALFGQSAEQCRGAVWVATSSEDDWDVLAGNFAIHEGSSISKWRDAVQYACEHDMARLIPRPVAVSIRGFFSMWIATGVCPALFGREEVLAARREAAALDSMCAAVADLAEAVARRVREWELEEARARRGRALRRIFSQLDGGGKGYVSRLEMRGLWEVGGWAAADSEEAEAWDTFGAACRDRGFDPAPGCSEEAFLACFPCVPPSAEIRGAFGADYEELTVELLEDFLAALVGGPNLGARFLAAPRRWDMVIPALLHDAFRLLDRDADGRLGSEEFRPFIEMVAGFSWSTPGWDSKLAKPWMPGWPGEERALQVWRGQFGEFCEARGLRPEEGLSEPDFVRYADDDCRLTDVDLHFFVCTNLRAGEPPMGHYISYADFFEASVQGSAAIPGYDDSFEGAYAWCLQGQSGDAGRPRSLRWVSEGVEYRVLAVPVRDRLPDKWKPVETSPGGFEWQLVQPE